MEVVLRRVSSATFVGRADELAVLDGALDRAAAGVPAFAFVAGESGVGKSRLVAEFEARATAAGARVLIGHCLELGGTVFPYAPLVDALRPVARELAECGTDLELPAGTRAALAELIPEFARGLDDPEPASQARLFEALLALIERLGRDRPVALVLEDLHWADPSTRDFLVFLVRSARTEPLCLLVTYRSDELHRRHPLRPVLAELERVPGVQRIAVERFSRDEVAAQLAGILDGPADRRPGRAPVRARAGQPALHRGAARRLGRRLRRAARDAARRAARPLRAPAGRRAGGRARRRRGRAADEPRAARRDQHAAGGRAAGGRARGRRPPGPRQPPRRDVRVPPRARRRGDLRGPAPGRADGAARGAGRGARGRPGAARRPSARDRSPPSWRATGAPRTTCRARSARPSRPGSPPGACSPTARRCATSSARSSCGTACPTPPSAPACRAPTCCAQAAAAAGDAFEAGRAVALQREALADGARGRRSGASSRACTPSWPATCGTRASTTRATTSCGSRSSCSRPRPSSSARSCAPRRPRA